MRVCPPSLYNSITVPSLEQADDVILTYYSASSVVSVLRQPSGGVVSSSCVERNPASKLHSTFFLSLQERQLKARFFLKKRHRFLFPEFLRSGSVSCSRVVSSESCRRDSALSSSSYLTGFSLLRVSAPGLWGKSKSSVTLHSTY